MSGEVLGVVVVVETCYNERELKAGGVVGGEECGVVVVGGKECSVVVCRGKKGIIVWKIQKAVVVVNRKSCSIRRGEGHVIISS